MSVPQPQPHTFSWLLWPIIIESFAAPGLFFFSRPVPSCHQQALPVGRLLTRNVTSQNTAMDPLTTVFPTPLRWMVTCAGWELRTATTDGAKLSTTSVSVYSERVLLPFVFVVHLDCSVEYVLYAIGPQWGRAWVTVLRREKLKFKKKKIKSMIEIFQEKCHVGLAWKTNMLPIPPKLY